MWLLIDPWLKLNILKSKYVILKPLHELKTFRSLNSNPFCSESGTGTDLEVKYFMILILRLEDTDPNMDTGAGDWLKIIQISTNSVLKPK